MASGETLHQPGATSDFVSIDVIQEDQEDDVGDTEKVWKVAGDRIE